jgi:hypothetical protein
MQPITSNREEYLDLREYQQLTPWKAITVMETAKRLAIMLRLVTEEAAGIGYSLEELASLDMQQRGLR